MFRNELVSKAKVTKNCRSVPATTAGFGLRFISLNSILRSMKSTILTPIGLAALLGALSIVSASVASGAGIPEPSLVLYGKVLNKFNGATTRLTQGQIIWTFKPLSGGAWVTVTNQLSNINDQFSYVLQVPCETEAVGFVVSPNTLKVLPGASTVDRSTVLIKGQPA